MKNILNMFKEYLLNDINILNRGNWKISENNAVGNNSCTPVIHPDAASGTVGTLLCGAMSAISLLVYYFCY